MSATAARPVVRRPAAKREAWLPTAALSSVLVLAGAASAVVALVVIVGFGGWRYYMTPLRVRAYQPTHHLLRPSGPVGQGVGIVGMTLLFLTLLYVARKRWKPLSRAGSQKTWLEAHIFCGLVGPALITLHTSFKFNGLVSVAYWSMMLVVASGFVGRYLYVRIPRTVRGAEVSLAEVVIRTRELRDALEQLDLSASLHARVDSLEASLTPSGHSGSIIGLFFGDFHLHRRLSRLEAEMVAAGAPRHLAQSARALLGERMALIRRLAFLERTRLLFNMWHVFHVPLVYLMFLIGIGHVALVLFMGYSAVKL